MKNPEMKKIGKKHLFGGFQRVELIQCSDSANSGNKKGRLPMLKYFWILIAALVSCNKTPSPKIESNTSNSIRFLKKSRIVDSTFIHPVSKSSFNLIDVDSGSGTVIQLSEVSRHGSESSGYSIFFEYDLNMVGKVLSLDDIKKGVYFKSVGMMTRTMEKVSGYKIIIERNSENQLKVRAIVAVPYQLRSGMSNQLYEFNGSEESDNLELK